MRVGIARGHQQGRHRNASLVELDRSCVISESWNKIELQWHVNLRRSLLEKIDELAVWKFAKAVEHNSRAAAKSFLRGISIRTGQVVRNSDFKRNSDVGIDRASRSLRAAHFNAAFFLNRARIENLVWMG